MKVRQATSGPAATDQGPDGATPGHRVRIAGATKRFGRTDALSDIHLDLGPGRFVVLLGPSGSGKSTLARCLAGVERIDGGTIHLGERLVGDARRHLPPERRNLAMVFQDYALWPHLTASGNVGYALKRRRLDAAQVHERTRTALERVGLGHLGARYPHEMSGGEQQRVALARALVARPGLLIFDEPLSNLDADLRERLRIEIATLTRESGATAVYITHDQSEAFALADEIVVLDRGRIVQHGPPEEIYRRPATPFVARFTGIAADLTGTVTGVTGERAVVDVAGGALHARPGSNDVVPGARVRALVRPAATAIVSAASGPGVLAGTVIDVAYRGRGYDHVVATAAGSLAAVFDPERHPLGSPVVVAVAEVGCVAFAEPTARVAAPVVVDA